MLKRLLFLSCIMSFLLQAFSQTAVTNFSYGATTISRLFEKGTNVYFLAKPAADAQEWYKFNTANNSLTQLTNDHYRATGSTIFRAPVRIGDNVFVSAAKPATLLNLEFFTFRFKHGYRSAMG